VHMPAVLAGRRPGSAAQRQSGQIVVLFAIAITATLGLVGLAVDVGHAYERQQFVQGVADAAARAGAFEVYASHIALSPSSSDELVVARMVETVQQGGLTVANAYGDPPTLSQPPGAACGNLAPSANSAYLQAVYLDASGQPIAGSTGRVGNGTIPSNAEGVRVTSLETCVSHFFAGALGFGNFDVSSDGMSVSTSSETEPSPLRP
jgi:uncharacterized membrane protein